MIRDRLHSPDRLGHDVLQTPAPPSFMNHGVTIGAHDREVFQSCLARASWIAQTFAVVHVSIMPTKPPVRALEIKATTQYLARDASGRGEDGVNLFLSLPSLAFSVTNDHIPRLALQRGDLLSERVFVKLHGSVGMSTNET